MPALVLLHLIFRRYILYQQSFSLWIESWTIDELHLFKFTFPTFMSYISTGCWVKEKEERCECVSVCMNDLLCKWMMRSHLHFFFILWSRFYFCKLFIGSVYETFHLLYAQCHLFLWINLCIFITVFVLWSSLDVLHALLYSYIYITTGQVPGFPSNFGCTKYV